MSCTARSSSGVSNSPALCLRHDSNKKFRASSREGLNSKVSSPKWITTRRHSGESRNPAIQKFCAADKTQCCPATRGSFNQLDSGFRRNDELFIVFILALVFAQIVNDTHAAFRLARLADITAVQ